MGLKVRRAKTEKQVSIVKDLAALDKHTRGATSPMNLNDNAIEKGWVVLGYEGKRAVGFMVVRHCVREPHTSLYYIGIHPDHKGKGYGEDMVWWLLDDSPHRRIRLVCEVDNEAANAFYKRIGFEHQGTSMTKGGTINNIWILED